MPKKTAVCCEDETFEGPICRVRPCDPNRINCSSQIPHLVSCNRWSKSSLGVPTVWIMLGSLVLELVRFVGGSLHLMCHLSWMNFTSPLRPNLRPLTADHLPTFAHKGANQSFVCITLFVWLALGGTRTNEGTICPLLCTCIGTCPLPWTHATLKLDHHLLFRLCLWIRMWCGLPFAISKTATTSTHPMK